MRPAFFGEVVFPRSRAVDIDFGDDFDENVQPRYEIAVDVKGDQSNVLPKVQHLIIACGFHPSSKCDLWSVILRMSLPVSDFAQVHLIPDQPKSELVFSIKVFPRQPSSDEANGRETEHRSNPASILDFYYVPGTSSLVGVTVSKYAPVADAAHAVVTKVRSGL